MYFNIMDEIFKNLILERNGIDDENYIELDKFWEKASTEFAKDIDKSIKFMMDSCTADQFSTISEFFDKIVEKTHSKEFIDCLYKVAEKYPEETKKYNIISFIDDLKDMI